MIPKPNSTPYLDSLNEKLMADEEKIFEYPEPTPAHLELLARYIHSYNYIELNARRCIETFALAKMLKSRPSARVKFGWLDRSASTYPVSGLPPAKMEIRAIQAL